MNFDTIAILETDRLRLRPFSIADAARVQELAGDARVAETTVRIPHPYGDGVAEAWIAAHPHDWRKRRSVTFAVELRETRELVGAVSLRLFAQGPRAELGFWIGLPFWNQGYATEAGREVVRFGFEELGLQGIQARHLLGNTTAGRVLEKLGMRYEGVTLQGASRGGVLLDVTDYFLPARGAQRSRTAA
ncbi:MAG TPA: GNAT family N-acetyltransferase [Luteolibacter sp.]